MSNRTFHSEKYEAIFVVDSLYPLMGMGKAVNMLTTRLVRQTKIIVIAGENSNLEEDAARQFLNLPYGFIGRLRAISLLRNSIKHVPDSIPIVAVGIWAFVTVAIAILFQNKRVILWEHSLLCWRLKHQQNVQIAALLMKVLSFKLDCVVSVSKPSAQISSRLLGPKINCLTIPNLVENYFTPSKAQKPVFGKVIGIGALTKGKNWKLLIEAFALLPQKYTLDIYGDGAERDRLQHQIHSLNLGNRVSLRGYISNVSSLIGQYSVLAHPSFAETSGFVFYEAAAAGIPVVALEAPVMNESIPLYIPGSLSKCDPRIFAAKLMEAEIDNHDFVLASKRLFEAQNSQAVLKLWEEVLFSVR